jgi:hypothetical protein
VAVAPFKSTTRTQRSKQTIADAVLTPVPPQPAITQSASPSPALSSAIDKAWLQQLLTTNQQALTAKLEHQQ